MIFSSTLFLFVFLPIVLLAYFVMPSKLKNLFLLLVSLIFYAWGEVEFAYIMLSSIILNFIFAWLIHQYRENSFSKLLLILVIALNLSALIYFKYLNFVLSSFGFDYDESITLPLGISFYTFHALSYIIDVYRQKSEPQKNLINLGLYISNFPQLVAGPIVRYPEISKQLTERTMNTQDLYEGIKRFILGLGKKALIANTLAQIADQVFAKEDSSIGCGMAWLGIISYSLQIYFDFSGYSDMAIGLGRMFGFHFPENFNYPYIAVSLRDFWRRWHISLSNWFRDYLYIPLGGNQSGGVRTFFNLFLIFFLCGLWHGANWTFVLWGMWHGVFIVIERVGFENLLKKVHPVFRHIYTLLIIIIGWVFFRSGSFIFSLSYLSSLAGFTKVDNYIDPAYFDTDMLICLIAGIIGSTPFIPNLREKLNSEKTLMTYVIKISSHIALIIIFVFSLMSLSNGTYNPFIYFRF